MISVETLKQAIRKKRFVVYYQPQVDLVTHRLVGVEALVRIEEEDNRLIAPARFIHLAEENHLIQRITRFVVVQAFADFSRMLDAYQKLSLSINLSIQDLVTPSLADWVLQMANKRHLPKGKIVFEVSATRTILSDSRALETLKRLKRFGFKVSIDDFGTDPSLLDQLRQLPATEVKIDRSLVIGMATSGKSKELIRQIIDLCRELELDTIAEGVEDQEAEQLLVAMSCQIGQGFLYSRAIAFARLNFMLLHELRLIPTDTVCSESMEPASVQHVSFAPKEEEQMEASSSAAYPDQAGMDSHLLSCILPLTGPFSFIGRSIRFGAQLAMAQKRHAFADLKLGLEFFDDTSEISRFKEIFQSEIKPQSLALACPVFSVGHTAQFARVADQSEIPVVAPFSGCEYLRHASEKNLYNFKPSFKDELDSLIAFLKEKGERTLLLIPPSKVMRSAWYLCEEVFKEAQCVSYHPEELSESVKRIREYRPQNIVFLGTAKTLVHFIDEIGHENVHYYATSLVGTGMIKKLLSRKAKLKLEITEPLPDFRSELSAARAFRNAFDKYAHKDEKWLNSISFEGYLVISLLIDLYLFSGQTLDRDGLRKELQQVCGYDLGLDYPLSWDEENRQLLHHVYQVKV